MEEGYRYIVIRRGPEGEEHQRLLRGAVLSEHVVLDEAVDGYVSAKRGSPSWPIRMVRQWPDGRRDFLHNEEALVLSAGVKAAFSTNGS